MAGHEAMLAQWFHRPLQRADIELAGRCTAGSAVKAFPRQLGIAIWTAQPGSDIRLPIDIWAFPAVRRSAGLPCLSFEGPGGALLSRARHVPVLRPDPLGDQGPRAHEAATPRDASSACARRRARAQHRPSPGRLSAAGRLTSNDPPSSLPELFQSIGTIGHEMSAPRSRSTAPWKKPSTR